MLECKRILTIEDDPTIRSNILAYLEDSGYEMLQASDGLKGLELFREEQPDLVLCDLRMPMLDGLDVLDEIAQISPNTPVIIVSGAGMIGDAIESLKRGAWDFVTKPIPDMQVLEAAVNKALDRARLLQENRTYQSELERVNQELSAALEELKADQEAGRELQARLLPEDEHCMGGFAFRRRLYPAMYLSGDFVDYFSIGKDFIGFYMADVSGHGAGSAFVTVIVKTLMTHLIEAFTNEGDETILKPAQTLERINEALNKQNLNKYITMFYGVIDIEKNRIIASNGGQYPYPILFDGLQARQIECRSRPVGLFDGVQFPIEEIQLPEGFLLLLLSDGIFEIMPEKSNKASFRELLNRVSSTEVSFDELMDGIELKNNSQLRDDVTMLAISRQSTDVQ